MLDQSPDDVFDFELSRKQPSLQLVGRPDHNSLDLPKLQQKGVRLVSRLLDIESGSRAVFDDNLVAFTAAADAKLAQLLQRIDQFVDQNGLSGDLGEAEPLNPFFWPATAPESIDLETADIGTVVWATGFRRRYPWLNMPVLDRQGEVVHKGGITPVPGLYILGMQFQRRRNSAFIDGVGKDAVELAEHISEQEQHDALKRRVA
jgi:putative flavoprotein involved in K+ transport